MTGYISFRLLDCHIGLEYGYRSAKLAIMYHNIDVIMSTVVSQITSLPVVYLIVYSGANQRKIKAPRHWPLCGEFTGTGEFPAQRASNAENGSIWWRHRVLPCNSAWRVSICFAATSASTTFVISAPPEIPSNWTPVYAQCTYFFKQITGWN